MSIHQLDLRLQAPDGTSQTYSSATVEDLLAAQQGYVLSDHLPTPDQGLVADWQADALIASLQNLAATIATQLNAVTDPASAQPMRYTVRRDELSLAQLTESMVNSIRYYTKNGVSMVEYTSLGNPTPTADSNAGYQDLNALISFLDAGRNTGSQLANVSQVA